MSTEKDKNRITSVFAEFPEDEASALSRLSFSWLSKFVWKCWKTKISKEDLYKVPKEQESRIIGDNFIKIWTQEHAVEDPENPWGLHKAIFRQAKSAIIISGIFEFIRVSSSQMSPLLLELFLKTYQAKESLSTGDSSYFSYTTRLYLICLGLCMMQLITTFSGNWGYWKLTKGAINVRTGLMSAIFDRSLQLSGLEKKNYSIGRATKMMSSDVLRIETYWNFLHFIWTCPFQILLSLVLLYKLIGWSMLAGFAVLAVSAPIQGYLIVKMSEQRPVIIQDYKKSYY